MTNDTSDIDTDAPASEQFDLAPGGEYDPPTAAALEALASRLERVPDLDTMGLASETLADLVAACKRLERAAEDARKEGYEDTLSDRVVVGEQVGPVEKRQGSHTYVEDADAAFAAVADAGEDPLSVASVKVGDLRDVLGSDADRYLGASEYEYFSR